jgi:putative hydrolase of HD superfamily
VVDPSGPPEAGDGDASLDARIDACLDALALKDERRTGWQLRGIDDPESVAGHTWGVAYLCLVFGESADGDIDVDRALRLAVLHDLGEAETGDIPTRADSTAETVDEAQRERRERAAVDRLLAPFAGSDAHRADWEEYEARETPEARFVKDMDLLDMCLQALSYEREGRYDPGEERDAFTEYDRLDEFFATAEPRLRTALGERLFARVRERYEAAKAARDGRDEDGETGSEDERAKADEDEAR